MTGRVNREGLIGASQPMLDLRREIDRVARSDAKILISGESGSGKEVVARAVHAGSRRAAAAFVPVNCAGLPETLLESELFGHVKGSFTGAYRDKPGKLEIADNGTIFLDEVGEMTLRMQGVLLRFVETGELQKVGGESTPGIVDVRVISATNRKLEDLIDKGEFRDDLFYRLNVIRLHVPPLRERKTDIPLLVNAALEQLVQTHAYIVQSIDAEAMSAMCEYAWPGNVRELLNVVERIVVTGRQPVATVADLPVELRSPKTKTAMSAATADNRRSVADELYRRIVHERESFWTAVYPLYMNREITKANVRDLVGKGLEEARGNYKIVARIFNMEPRDYKKLLNFLRKHECQVPFREYR